MICFEFKGNAAGLTTPPFIVFKGKRLPNQAESFVPNEWHSDKSESGWMNVEIFYNYISKVFHPWILENHIQTPVILFLDGHVSHKSLELSEFCSEKKIVLISFLPNCTHVCQPMDVVVFRPMKMKWAQVMNDYKASNPSEPKISKKDFCHLLNDCLIEVMKPDLIQKSFATTAIYPFGAEYFKFSNSTIQEEDAEDGEHDAHSEHSDHDEFSSEENSQNEFIEKLERLIIKFSPDLVSDFQESQKDWNGDLSSKNLFLVWQMAKNEVNQTNNIQPESNSSWNEARL